MYRRILLFTAYLFLAFSSAQAQDARTLHVVSTGDVHGAWFDRPYFEGGPVKTSLMSVSWYVDSLRNAVGRDNVLLLDAGDCLQGDNAVNYFNYEKTSGPHLFPRMVKYMGYDAIAIGNHDIETGHPVYDKVNAELQKYGIPWLGGNVIRTDDGLPYFPTYKLFDRAGMKVLVLGFENANMTAWLSENLYSGMRFLSLVPYVQMCVDAADEAFNPDVTVVIVHSGTGAGDGSMYESQALDVFNTLTGADLLICGHDHAAVALKRDGKALVNSGARAGFVAHSTISLDKAGSKNVDAEIVRLDKNKVDRRMRSHFEKEFEEVCAFSNSEVGSFAMTMSTRDAYAGMCDYVNLLHSVQLGATGAKVSFAAPLTYNGKVKEGKVIYNDMFTIYPYENQLYVMNLKGSEIKNYLEVSYNQWIQTPGEHVLKIRRHPEGERWSFAERTYNFDSAGGLVYTVDVTKPLGERISIKSLADGSAFNMDAMYPVALTSYRASGELLSSGTGLTKEQGEERIIARHTFIRELIYDYIKEHGTVTPATVGDKKLVGDWRFVPEQTAAPMIEADMKLVF